MIWTDHKPWAEFIFSRYLNRLFRKHFNSIHLLGEVPQIKSDLPVILLPNHSTWWDGFFVYLLNKKIFQRRLYLMMLEEQLRHFSFFRKVGAYSIEPGSARGIRESLYYTINILNDRSGDDIVICIFPQGVLSPWHKRPLDFKRGIGTILKGYNNKVNVLPLGIKALFLNEQYPNVFMKFGPCDIVDARTLKDINHYEQQEEHILGEIIEATNEGLQGTLLFSGSVSISDRVVQLQRNLGAE